MLHSNPIGNIPQFWDGDYKCQLLTQDFSCGSKKLKPEWNIFKMNKMSLKDP